MSITKLTNPRTFEWSKSLVDHLLTMRLKETATRSSDHSTNTGKHCFKSSALSLRTQRHSDSVLTFHGFLKELSPKFCLDNGLCFPANHPKISKAYGPSLPANFWFQAAPFFFSIVRRKHGEKIRYILAPTTENVGRENFFSPTKTQTISLPFHRATYQNTSEQEPHSWDLTLWTQNNFNLYCRFKWDITYRTLSCMVNVFQGNCTLINNLKNNLRESCHDRTFGVIAEIRLRYLLLCFSFTK